ncbi:MAG: hypothetical protein ABI472_22200 [Ginsengibacter sp.]
MKTTKFSILFLLFLAISFLTITCKHEIPIITIPGGGSGGDTTTQSASCSPDSVYFTNVILPLIYSNCATSGCHDAISRAEGVTLTDYSHIFAYVKPFNAGSSKLYTILSSTGEHKMPPSGPLKTDQVANIQKWINQGALNNQCNSGCDTALYTYSGAVSVTINTYCKGCHNPASLGGGVDLSTFAVVKASASGRLMGSINHTAGYSAMPKGTSKLADCQVAQIQKWINAGMPNN